MTQDGVGREPHHVACVLPHLCIARAISRSDAAAARPGRAPIYYGSITAGTGSGGSSTNNIPCMTRLSVSSVSFDNLHAKVRGVYRTLQFCIHNTCITEMSDTPHLMVCFRAAGPCYSLALLLCLLFAELTGGLKISGTSRLPRARRSETPALSINDKYTASQLILSGLFCELHDTLGTFTALETLDKLVSLLKSKVAPKKVQKKGHKV